MYVLVGAVCLFYMVLFLVSRKSAVQDPGGDSALTDGMPKIFVTMARWLYGRKTVRWLLPLGKQIDGNLRQLYPDRKILWLRQEYCVKKISWMLLILLVGTFLGALAGVVAEDGVALKNGSVTRGGYDGLASDLEISAVLPGNREETFEITVVPRELTEKEAQELYEVFVLWLPEGVLGKNKSLQEIESDLLLAETYEGYPFLVEWKSDRPDILTSDGRIERPKESEVFSLTAQVSYKNTVWEEALQICVLPDQLSEEEQIREDLQNLLEESDRNSRIQDSWTLPAMYRGKPLIWRQKVQNTAFYIWTATVMVAMFVYVMLDKDLGGELDKRRVSLKRAYPDMVQKLTLYLIAGMTVRGAFFKLASCQQNSPEGEKCQKKGKSQLSAVDEEMIYICRELQSGVSEADAYRHFGSRTGVREYIRLNALLVQNLRKGDRILLQRLREEVEYTWEERFRNSRKLAEEASAKLMIPMVMLLVIVMVMIMIPAFSASGI